MHHKILDADNIRKTINNDLKFSLNDRQENIRRASEISKEFVECGIITINCFITPTNQIRQIAKNILGNSFIEVYLNTPKEICMKRDVKGLWKKALNKEFDEFTSVDSPFEIPINPDIEINTNELTIEESVDKILNFILPKIM